jgi:diketogulonate reductase-like aldo/keto reductase
MDYVDLYLIHWPLNGVAAHKVPMHVLWAKMEELVNKGLTKSIGVSNFNIQFLADMLTYAKIKPAVN